MCCTVGYRYRDRFWRESVFDGVELVRKALDEAYGKDQVSLVSAVFRWMNHHSKMKDNGTVHYSRIDSI